MNANRIAEKRRMETFKERNTRRQNMAEKMSKNRSWKHLNNI